MASPKEENSMLASEISEVDLRDALHKVQLNAGLRYTHEDLLSLRPKKDVSDTGSPLANGVMTPPNLVCPRPPPPTPSSPVKKSNTTSGNEAGKKDTNGVTEDVLAELPNVEAPKKKKKKSSGINRKARGTGFEEFFADPPQTPDEYLDECDLYDMNLPFEARIQTCIQRYRARRNLDSDRANILTKYLMLGGIDASTTKAFTGGLDQETIENSTAEEIAAIQATDYVRTGSNNAKYYDGSENWVVDFEGVAKGFFSYRIPNLFPIDTKKDVELYALVIRNFLNYVLHHRVCEDYTMDVMAARKVCDLAEKELWAIKKIERKLPGDYNIATSTLYGGVYQSLQKSNEAWATEDPEYLEYAAVSTGFEIPLAERIFKTAIAFAGDDKMFMKVMVEEPRIVKSTTRSFEVVEIERPDVDSMAEYARVRNHEGKSGFIKPLGVIKLKYWEGPKLVPEDLTDEEDNEKCKAVKKDVIESFWLEDDILELCYVGLKMEIDVHELNVGAKFFDRIHGLYCSFFTHLPNEKMHLWKEPVPNTRPAPTEEDPEIEEQIMDEEAQKELDEDDKLMNATE